jgi:hypothetical protein
LVPSHYNFAELEKRHYYSSYWKFSTTILQLPQVCPFLRLRRPEAHLQALYLRIGPNCPPSNSWCCSHRCCLPQRARRGRTRTQRRNPRARPTSASARSCRAVPGVGLASPVEGATPGGGALGRRKVGEPSARRAADGPARSGHFASGGRCSPASL